MLTRKQYWVSLMLDSTMGGVITIPRLSLFCTLELWPKSQDWMWSLLKILCRSAAVLKPVWATTKMMFLKSIKFTMYLKTLPHLLLRDESAWSVSQWSRNSYSKFLEKKITPPQHLVINSFLAVVARKGKSSPFRAGLIWVLVVLLHRHFY